jgi:hypothetical protein
MLSQVADIRHSVRAIPLESHARYDVYILLYSPMSLLNLLANSKHSITSYYQLPNTYTKNYMLSS